jgi:hypothetical protein
MVAFSSAGFLSSITQRQPVHEQDHVWAAHVLAFGNGKLVDGQPVVCAGILEIDDPDDSPSAQTLTS